MQATGRILALWILRKFPTIRLYFVDMASTCFHVSDTDDLSVVGRISYDEVYRNKFHCFVFYDIYGNEYEFATWDDYLDWIDENSDLAYE